jgi:UDP-N-acetylglucosamine 2-epimerase (non-hydrolysing)
MAQTSVAVVIGTRSEAIKLAPVVLELADAWWAAPAIVVTGQHGAVVDEALGAFDLEATVRLPDVDGSASPGNLGAGLLDRLNRAFGYLRPGAVIVQGDTVSTLAGALAGFFRGTPVAHVEAGLRSHDLASPFPEEANRRMIGQVAQLHLAPTTRAAVNLLNESLPANRIVITGNTVVDALWRMTEDASPYELELTDPCLRVGALGRGTGRLIVVTAHWRESWGEPIRRIGRAVARLARLHPDITIVLAADMNPEVGDTLERQTEGLANVVRSGPVPYTAFVRLLSRADLVLTDSSGIQEEGASLGIPTLVMRETTERLEGLEVGIARLVGTDTERIVAEAEAVLRSASRQPGERPPSPYGDGRAAERVVKACAWQLGLDQRPADYLARPPLAQRH